MFNSQLADALKAAGFASSSQKTKLRTVREKPKSLPHSVSDAGASFEEVKKQKLAEIRQMRSEFVEKCRTMEERQRSEHRHKSSRRKRFKHMGGNDYLIYGSKKRKRLWLSEAAASYQGILKYGERETFVDAGKIFRYEGQIWRYAGVTEYIEGQKGFLFFQWDEGTKNGPDRSALLGHNFVYQETKPHGFYSSYFHQRISS